MELVNDRPEPVEGVKDLELEVDTVMMNARKMLDIEVTDHMRAWIGMSDPTKKLEDLSVSVIDMVMTRVIEYTTGNSVEKVEGGTNSEEASDDC